MTPCIVLTFILVCDVKEKFNKISWGEVDRSLFVFNITEKGQMIVPDKYNII